MRSLALAAAAVLTFVAPALAHDVWLQPNPFWIAPGGSAAVSVLVGHGGDRERWGVNPRRVLLLRSLAPSGAVTDRLPQLRAQGMGSDLPLRFEGAGVHVLSMESDHAVSTLTAPRFEAWLEEEGLTPAQVERRRTLSTGREGREVYSRRAKALIQVGPVSRAAQRQATARLGQTLELVPERDPYTLRSGEALPVRVWYRDRPLAGALVKLYDLAADDRPVFTARTDAQGRVRVPLSRRQGAWQLNVIWTRPVTGDPRGDFDTTFASLTFGWPSAR